MRVGIRELPGRKYFTIENDMERRHFIKLGTGAAIGGALTACGGGGHYHRPVPTPPPPEPVKSKLVIGWNNVLLAALRSARTPGPLAARAAAIVHTAMYNAWAAYDAVALSTQHGAQLRRPAAERTPANQLRALSFAAYAALLDQFPAQQADFDAHMAALAYNPARASLAPTTPEGLGTLAATVLLAAAHADGANQLGDRTGGAVFGDYSGYVARNPAMIVAQSAPRALIPYAGRWQPLTYLDAGGVLRTQSFLLPFWGQVRPFALASGAQFRPGPPVQPGTQAFTDQALEMVRVQAALTETQKVMADFWSGGTVGDTPVAMWSQFAQFVSERDHYVEENDVKLLFALTNAMSDASIAAWDAKRYYDSERPITGVRYALCAQTITAYSIAGPAAGLRQIAGEAWMPYQLPSNPTLPFPDHVSGHSTLSAASAEALKLFTGSDRFGHSVTVAPHAMLLDPALPQAAVTLQWDTFSDAACEAGTSRIYAGQHFPAADSGGRTLGASVGAAVFEKAKRYWEGTAA